MPNRIIKESICTSGNLNDLSWQEEVFFYRILVNCDDFGRMDARKSILLARCFPLRLTTITEKDIGSWLFRLRSMNLVDTYESNGQPYLQVVTWDRHQQIRARKSKYPSPDGNKPADDVPTPTDASTGNQLQSDDINGNQEKSSETKCTRNPIQSNPNPNPNPIRADGEPSSPLQVERVLVADDSVTVTMKTTEEINGEVRVVFRELGELRGYQPTVKRSAEARSIRSMLKTYTSRQIIDTWKTLKAEPFWVNKELFMMNVEAQIGAMIHGAHQRSLAGKNHKTNGNYGSIVAQS